MAFADANGIRLYYESHGRGPVLVLVSGIDEPVHVLGHSMGGRVAQWFALDYADVTRSLVIVGAADEKPAQGQATTSKYLADHLADAELVIIPDAAQALHVERPAPFNAAVRQFLAAH
jgi:pimeloyl-ACP methyl ester carboxylesterase